MVDAGIDQRQCKGRDSAGRWDEGLPAVIIHLLCDVSLSTTLRSVFPTSAGSLHVALGQLVDSALLVWQECASLPLLGALLVGPNRGSEQLYFAHFLDCALDAVVQSTTTTHAIHLLLLHL